MAELLPNRLSVAVLVFSDSLREIMAQLRDLSAVFVSLNTSSALMPLLVTTAADTCS